MLDAIAPARPAEDVLSRVVRVTLGGKVYPLPVLSIKDNREWKAALVSRLGDFMASVEAADEDTSTILGLLEHQVDDLIELLATYDVDHILPTRDEIEAIRPDASRELVIAVREVWRAANPLVVTALARLTATPTEPSSPPTSSPPTSITGPRKKSRTA